MVGRAGRPQFDTTGVAVVMTQSSAAARFLELVRGYLERDGFAVDTAADGPAGQPVLDQRIRVGRLCRGPEQVGWQHAGAGRGARQRRAGACTGRSPMPLASSGRRPGAARRCPRPRGPDSGRRMR